MKFILNADDFGRTATTNEAITYGFVNGYLSRTTIMVNMPYYEEAKQLALQNEFYDKVGLHINLTSGVPLTEAIRKSRLFTDENGRFNGLIFKKKYKWHLKKAEKKAVEQEIEAQINRYLNDGFILKHADSHGHVHTFPVINKIVLRLLNKYEFKSVRISRNIELGWLKKLYKKFLNIRNKKFNAKNGARIDYFGSCKEVMNNFDKINGSGEIMLHPNSYYGDMWVEEDVTYKSIYEFIQNHGGAIL